MKDKNEKTDPLISVIVPIYNVEKYVRKCLESLRGQTMKEIEVICIDDGSTDRSGRIADEYESSEFPIFRVIHTENRGLSAARNRGLDEARAEWIMFVDSDDWVEPDFCRIPYEAGIENKADLAIFGAYRTNRNGRIKHTNKNEAEFGLLDHETAIDCGSIVAWNKLFKRELFDMIRFPEGHVYEEVGTTHKLIYRAFRIIQLPEKLYYYRFRNDSISHTLEYEKDRLDMWKSRYDDLIRLGYPRDKANICLYGNALRCYGRSTDDVYLEADRLLQYAENSDLSFPIKEKIMFHIWSINKRLYRFMYQAFVRIQKHL